MRKKLIVVLTVILSLVIPVFLSYVILIAIFNFGEVTKPINEVILINTYPARISINNENNYTLTDELVLNTQLDYEIGKIQFYNMVAYVGEADPYFKFRFGNVYKVKDEQMEEAIAIVVNDKILKAIKE